MPDMSPGLAPHCSSTRRSPEFSRQMEWSRRRARPSSWISSGQSSRSPQGDRSCNGSEVVKSNLRPKNYFMFSRDPRSASRLSEKGRCAVSEGFRPETPVSSSAISLPLKPSESKSITLDTRGDNPPLYPPLRRCIIFRHRPTKSGEPPYPRESMGRLVLLCGRRTLERHVIIAR